MSKILEEVKLDLSFIRAHSMQPQWFKVGKIFLLAGFLAVYGYLFSLPKTAVFLLVFFFLSFLVHLVYRVKTNRFQQSWLDFIVVEDGGQVRAKSIGIYYYTAVIVNAALSIFLSQVFF